MLQEQSPETRRDLALFNVAIDSKLRGCDVVSLRRNDVEPGGWMMSRAIIQQKKTGRPGQFENTSQSREAIAQWCNTANLWAGDYVFPSRRSHSPHLSTRQYARFVEAWVSSIGLDRIVYGTHSMRRMKATLICRHTMNLRAVQPLLGDTKLESTVRSYVGSYNSMIY